MRSTPPTTRRFLPALAAFAVLISAPASAQQQGPFSITKIDTTFEKTPQYNTSIGPQRRADSKDWLFVEVEFAYEPRQRGEDEFLDEVTFNYYILLNNKGPQNPTGTLLVGSVTHVAIPIGKGLRSVAFVSPRTLERFFGGRIPPNANAAVEAVGVTATRQGQVVSELSTGPGKNSPQWWNQFQQTTGYVLNKNETPFAPLFGDYYEAIKSRPGGL